MAVEKMDMLNIAGAIDDFDYIADKYIIGSEIQVEDARELKRSSGVEIFTDANPYIEEYKQLCDLCFKLGIDPSDYETEADCEKIDIGQFCEQKNEEFTDIISKKEQYALRISDNNMLISQLETMGDLSTKIEDIFSFEFVKIRFGRLTKESHRKLEMMGDKIDAIFIKCKEEENYVYGMYFTPKSCEEDVDDIFISLNFERIRISDKAKGVPKEALLGLVRENAQLEEKSKNVQNEIDEFLNINKPEIIAQYKRVKRGFDAFDLRTKAVHTHGTFYISGWLRHGEAQKLKETMCADEKVHIMAEISEDTVAANPPTSLKNIKLFRPFEFMVKMYSLPAYNEIDPTPIMAITYIIMFGMMFGDVGQGIVLTLLGFLVYKIRKIDLAAIIGTVGISATVFGFLYGSVFGLEEVFEPLWINPSKETTTILITAVALGAVLIVMSMIINLINSARAKNWGEFFFSQNGLAGLVFYVSVIAAVYFAIVKGTAISVAVVLLLFILPLLIIMMKGPLTNLIKRRKKLFDESPGSYITESIFEMIEVILSYVTNTVSFIRIGAFALVHAGMMLVVMNLMEMAGSAGGVVFVAGNIFVMCLEAFLVGIQTMRLEFYELFGRFYRGTGRAFVPNKDKKRN